MPWYTFLGTVMLSSKSRRQHHQSMAANVNVS